MGNRMGAEMYTGSIQFPNLAPVQTPHPIESLPGIPDVFRWQKNGGAITIFGENGKGVSVKVFETVIKCNHDELLRIASTGPHIVNRLLEADTQVSGFSKESDLLLQRLWRSGGPKIWMLPARRT